jgi:hypothetical protein
MELARAGGIKTVTDIKAALRSEGYAGIDAHLQGTGFRNQLRKLMITARAPASPDPRAEERAP